MIYNEKYVGDVIFQKIYTDEHFNRHTNYGEKDQYLMQCHMNRSSAVRILRLPGQSSIRGDWKRESQKAAENI